MAKAGDHLLVKCVICTKEYRQSRSDQECCSKKCNSRKWRYKNYKYSYIKCDICDNIFKRTHSAQKYCSNSCAQIMSKKLHKIKYDMVSNHKGKGWAKGTNISIESIIKANKTKHLNGTLQNMNRANASWKASWHEIGGKRKYYRSRWESNYARYLEYLKSLDKIIDWEHEPTTFWFDKVKRGCVSYLPDFKVIENDNTIAYHEVKGWMDDRSKTKIKRMKIYYPNIRLIIIEKEQYMEIKNKLSKLINGWE